ncbi:MAG TPA: VTT domain-containing protein [Gallionellaceae bacterium]
MKKAILFLVLLAGIAGVVAFRDHLNAHELEVWIREAGPAAPLLFMAIYAVGTVFFMPGSLLTLLGGAMFGPWLGTFCSLTSATVGAMLSFLVARYLASDWVAQKASGRLKQIVTGVENEGWHFVAFTRLVPLFPFNLLNYALGLTRISFTQYSIATYICMLPGAIAYTWLGYAGKEAIAGGEGAVQKIMLAIALLAIVSFLPRLVSALRRPPMIAVPQLKQRMDSKEDLLLLDVRPTEAYNGEQGHVAGATHVPLKELEQRLQELDAWRDKPVVTICRTDRMSSQAAKLLAKKGFSNVKVARMGMTDWLKHSYPAE